MPVLKLLEQLSTRFPLLASFKVQHCEHEVALLAAGDRRHTLWHVAFLAAVRAILSDYYHPAPVHIHFNNRDHGWPVNAFFAAELALLQES